MLKKILESIKKNFCFIIFFAILLFLLTFELPYSISKTGGIIDLSKRIQSENDIEESGSFNMAYVTEVRPTIVNVIISLLNPNYDLEKIQKTTESEEEMNFRGKISLQESMNNALKVAYHKANLSYLETNQKIIVTYLFEEADTDLKVGDEILTIDNMKVNQKADINTILQKKSENEVVTVEVQNHNKTYKRTATLKKIENKIIIGMVVAEVSDLKLDPEVTIDFKKSESGASGGLMMSLAIYDNLTGADITKGRKIVGTGTIDTNGDVGEISGIKYKLKAAIKNKADIFLVPAGDNYEEAIKIKEKNNYHIIIVPIKNFEDALEYLKK